MTSDCLPHQVRRVWDLLAPATATRVLADSRSHLAAGALAARLSLLHTSPQCDVLFTPAGATVAVDGVMAAGGGGARVGGAGGATGYGEAPKAAPDATAATSTASASAAATAATETAAEIATYRSAVEPLRAWHFFALVPNVATDLSTSNMATDHSTAYNHAPPAPAAAATMPPPRLPPRLPPIDSPVTAATMPLPWLQRAAVESASVPRGAWPVWRPLRLPAACRSAGGPSVEALGTALEAAAALDAQHGAPTDTEGAPSTAHRAWQADYAAAAVELDFWLRCLHAGASICSAVPAVDPNMEDESDESVGAVVSTNPNMEDESDEYAHEYAPAALHGAALGELLARHRRPSALRILMVNEQVPGVTEGGHQAACQCSPRRPHAPSSGARGHGGRPSSCMSVLTTAPTRPFIRCPGPRREAICGPRSSSARSRPRGTRSRTCP